MVVCLLVRAAGWLSTLSIVASRIFMLFLDSVLCVYARLILPGLSPMVCSVDWLIASLLLSPSCGFVLCGCFDC